MNRAFCLHTMTGGALALLVATGLRAQVPPGPFKAGFPSSPAGVVGAGALRGRFTIADLGLTPGHKSIVFGTAGRKLIVLKYDGSLATGFPVSVPAEIVSGPSVADLDGNGSMDIVVGYGSTFEGPTVPGGVVAYRNNGTLLWQRVAGDFDENGIADGVYSSPAIADVDGDGLPEVIWGGFDARVYVVEGATGNDKPDWPRFVRDTIFATPAIHDIDGDGLPDIIIGVDAHLEGPPYNTPDGGCLHVYRGDSSEVAGFPQCFDQVLWSSPAVGDIDGDGEPEIVFGTGTYYSGGTHRVYALNCNGTPVQGWPVSVEGQVFSSPALADLDGDGIPEVIVTDDNSSPSSTFHCYAFSGNGTRRFKVVPKSYFGTTPNAGDPVVADVVGDSQPEILIPINTEVCVLSATGTQLTDNGTHFAGAFSYFCPTSVTAVAVEDFEPDGLMVEVTAMSAVPAQSATANPVAYVWNPSATPRATPPWGVFHQDARHLGVLPGTPACGGQERSFYTVTPCRVVDTRWAAGPVGGPPLSAETSRSFDLAGRCGVPSDAAGLSMNLTVADPSSDGSLTVFPGTGTTPLANTISFASGKIRANNAVIGLANGALTVTNHQASGTVNVIIDINGYFR